MTITTHNAVNTGNQPLLRRVASASAIGTAAEYYDFFAYGTAAAGLGSRREEPTRRSARPAFDATPRRPAARPARAVKPVHRRSPRSRHAGAAQPTTTSREPLEFATEHPVESRPWTAIR